MQYVLGNMLNGAGGLNADGLSLDLQFAADKTLTARKGPTPVFTRGSTGTFVGSDGLIQSAAVNTARFDHTSAGVCRGLLIEESRTNVALYSGAWVNNIGWAGLLTSTPSGTGPDGNSAYELAETTASGLQSMANTGGTGSTQATSVISGITYTGSIFLKKITGSIDWVQITHGGAGFGVSQYANVNISNGTIGNSSGGTARVEAYANGWYRVSWTCAATSTALTNNVIVAGIQNTNGTTRLPSYAGSTANKFLAAMAQFEVGSFPTSYIPTVASSVVRSADVCSITGGDFTSFWNRFAGTCVIGVGSSVAGGGRFISNNTGARTLELFHNSGLTGIDFFEAAGANEIRVITTPIFPVKLGLAYAINDYQSSANGILGGVDTNTGGTIPDPNALHIGSLGGSTLRLTGHIQSVRYYKKRLPNSKLVALTT